jgi:hypothetical protein
MRNLAIFDTQIFKSHFLSCFGVKEFAYPGAEDSIESI